MLCWQPTKAADDGSKSATGRQTGRLGQSRTTAAISVQPSCRAATTRGWPSNQLVAAFNAADDYGLQEAVLLEAIG
jgi:hypothetical protein